MSRTRLMVLAFIVLGLGLLSAAYADVKLNEVFYSTSGNDNPNTMFTELWGTADADIGGWTVIGWRGGTQQTITIPDNSHIPTDGYFVIGNTSQVPNVDYVCGGGTGGGVDWQNSSTTHGCIGIELRNVDGDLVDQVCYGTCTADPGCSDGGSTVPFTAPDQGMARIPDHQDSDNSGVDWQLTNTLTPGAPNEGVPCHTRSVVLSEIRQNDGTGTPVLLDTVVVVRGIVNVANHILTDTSHTAFSFQDDDAGVHLYGAFTHAEVVPGDCVLVTANVGFYDGKTELNYSNMGNCGFAIEPRGHVDPPAPLLITGASTMEAFEGMLVRMDNVSIVSGTWPTAEGDTGKLRITDGAGTIDLFVLPTTDIDGTPQPQGNFNVVGVMSQYDYQAPYDGFYEIIPRALSDISALGADEHTGVALAQEFKLAGSYPNPFNGTAEIRYEVGSARELSLAIFDVLGREVLSQRLSALTPGLHTFSWSPTGATGLYLARMTGTSGTQTAKLLYLR